ncbi:MAG TPA: hypothetical protein VLM40_20560, partial [Gemmata sp.]|nr:hypothetical protein [Gemmata sp.]
MSGRTVAPIRRPVWTPKFLLALGLLAAGLFSTLPAPAQDEPDSKSPLPPIQTKRPIAIDKNRAIFLGRFDAKGNRSPNTGIVDFRGIAAETASKDNPSQYVNSDEYQAWTAVVQHTRQFTNDEIEAGAARDLTRDDLTTVIEGNAQFAAYRLDPIRFEGWITRVRRIEGSSTLKLQGTPELYEALLIPIDEPMPEEWDRTIPFSVSVVFTELPQPLAAVKQKPFGEWVEVNAWAVAAGFFFKVRRDAPGEPAIPVLVGRSVTLLKREPVAPGGNPAALDRNLRVFRLIENDAVIARGQNNWEEVSAWNRVLLHARRFSAEDLESYASEISFLKLFEDGKRELEVPDGRKNVVDYHGPREYKLDLLKFEGRLVKLEKVKPSQKLLAAGVQTTYEGWIIPKNAAAGNPICIAFTDPPEGVEATGQVNRWGSFAGYAFKLLRYQSGERDKDDPSRYVSKRAPLLI